MGHIEVSLGDDLKGGVHAENGNAEVNGFNVSFGNVSRNGSATALINLTELAGLPYNIFFIKDITHKGNEFSACIAGAALSAGTGILGHNYTASDEAAVSLFVALCIRGIKRRVNVGRKALGISAHLAGICTERDRDLVDKVNEKVNLHAGSAAGADLFLIGKNAHKGVRRIGILEECGKCGIGADAVVVTVSADESSVKTDITSLECGNGGKLCRKEVLFSHSVLFVKDLHNHQLNALFTFTFCGLCSDYEVKRFTADTLTESLGHLILCEVREKIADAENRIVVVLSDNDVDGGTVGKAYDSVKSKRDGSPLILLDTAVVVGLKVCYIVVLVKGILLEIKTG